MKKFAPIIFSVSLLLHIFPLTVSAQDTPPKSENGNHRTVTDIDGNVYKTVKIGNQEWMAENLKVTHYRNGEAIPNIKLNSKWKSTKIGAYCSYKNEDKNAKKFGYLYNWYAIADSRNIAPEGWHVPTDEDWIDLAIYLGMNPTEAEGTHIRGTDEGGMLKESGIMNWKKPNTGASNQSGFSALPGGWRGTGRGRFVGLHKSTYFWSSSEMNPKNIWVHSLYSDKSEIFRSFITKGKGFSVRCIRDK